MRKDISFPPIDNVVVTVVKHDRMDWKVYLINRGTKRLENIMVSSRGFGEKNGEKQSTSTLRHMIPHLDAEEYALIERIQPEVFHLNNQYWVSFYIENQLYDKKYIFVPDSLVEDNLSYVEELDAQGIQHI